MFRAMRRKKQALTQQEMLDILQNGSTGILGVIGDNGYPYTVPLNFVFLDGKIYFHSAKQGHKIDGILCNDKVSFCIIERDVVIPEIFATDYRSVIVFGRAKIVQDDILKRTALEALIDKYSFHFHEAGRQEIEREWNSVCLIEITIEQMTGKRASNEVLLHGRSS